jgi:hypothetical protein
VSRAESTERMELSGEKMQEREIYEQSEHTDRQTVSQLHQVLIGFSDCE